MKVIFRTLSILLLTALAASSQQVDWIAGIRNKPFVDPRQYNFTPQSPGGSLSVGSNTITLSPLPAGIGSWSAASGGLNKHYLYISGGTGTAEAVPITGVSGSNVTITAANTHSGAWTIQSATGGYQEGIFVAKNAARAFVAYGGGFNQDWTADANINLYGPLYFPPGWGQHYQISGINFTVLLGASYSYAVYIDSMDFTTIDFQHCQIYWPGQQNGQSIYLFNPVNANGEASTAITASTFTLPTVVPAQVSGAAGTLGYAVRLTCGASASTIAGNTFRIRELNGGQYGVYIDNPDPGCTFGVNGNRFLDFYAHGQDVAAIKLGTSATSLINGNTWIGTVYAGSTAGVQSYGRLDTFIVNVQGGAGNGFQFETGSTGNTVVASTIAVGGTNWVNSGTGNRLYFSGATVNVNPVVGASPYVYQNKTGRVVTAFLSGTITSFGLSADGVSYGTDSTGATNSHFTLPPDGYVKIIYPGSAPVLFLYY